MDNEKALDYIRNLQKGIDKDYGDGESLEGEISANVVYDWLDDIEEILKGYK